MKCFFHSADLDGKASGAIVKRVYPQCVMIPIDYGEAFPWNSISRDEHVYMVDFALQPFADMVCVGEMCRLVWIDHHQTAIQEAQKREFSPLGVREEGKAACELTWNYFYPYVDMPKGIELLGRYDVWDHQHPDTVSFQCGMKRLRSDVDAPVWEAIFSKDKAFLENTIHAGQIILRYQEMENAKYCQTHVFETEFDGYRAIAVNRGMVNSRFFEDVWDPDLYDLMIAFSWGQPGNWTISLYTTAPNVNVGDIAKKYGGGGHARAAGFQWSIVPFELKMHKE